jgi:ketosteroid isomerase-like protein
MDDTLAINIGRTKIRDGYNDADFGLIRRVLDDDLVNFSDNAPCWFGSEGIGCLREQLTQMWAQFAVKYTVIIIEIQLKGDMATEYGWQIFELTPKAGGIASKKRERYVDIWQKKNGEWKLTVHITNRDVPMTLAREA